MGVGRCKPRMHDLRGIFCIFCCFSDIQGGVDAWLDKTVQMLDVYFSLGLIRKAVKNNDGTLQPCQAPELRVKRLERALDRCFGACT